MQSSQQDFITGFRKVLLYARVALHVVIHSLGLARRGRMEWRMIPTFLRRAWTFLCVLYPNKAVRRGHACKLHLYVPAYPTRAFFASLEKFFRAEPGPVTVVLSMTRACGYRCAHCYQRKDAGSDLPMDVLKRTAVSMQEAGVTMFDIEGGEPLLRAERLVELMEGLDDRAEIWVNTTGAGLTDEKVDRTIHAGLFGVMVSVHSPDPASHDAFSGAPGAFDVACDALRRFGARGVFTAINCCAIADTVSSGQLDDVIALGRKLGCAFVQVIHPKPAGAWLGRREESDSSDAFMNRLRAIHARYNHSGPLRLFPAVSAQVSEESEQMFGCTAGGIDRFYFGADGEVQPCEFLNVSFGNVLDEPFPIIFSRMRSFFRRPGCDWLCCTQAEQINRIIAERGLERTPIPWEITQEFIGSWDRGPETPLYKRLGIYGDAR